MKNTKLVHADVKVWGTIRNALPKMSDSKRSRLVGKVFLESGFMEKLRPELTDTSNDKLIKRILKDLI